MHSPVIFAFLVGAVFVIGSSVIVGFIVTVFLRVCAWRGCVELRRRSAATSEGEGGGFAAGEISTSQHNAHYSLHFNIAKLLFSNSSFLCFRGDLPHTYDDGKTEKCPFEVTVDGLRVRRVGARVFPPASDAADEDIHCKGGSVRSINSWLNMTFSGIELGMTVRGIIPNATEAVTSENVLDAAGRMTINVDERNIVSFQLLLQIKSVRLALFSQSAIQSWWRGGRRKTIAKCPKADNDCVEKSEARKVSFFSMIVPSVTIEDFSLNSAVESFLISKNVADAACDDIGVLCSKWEGVGTDFPGSCAGLVFNARLASFSVKNFFRTLPSMNDEVCLQFSTNGLRVLMEGSDKIMQSPGNRPGPICSDEHASCISLSSATTVLFPTPESEQSDNQQHSPSKSWTIRLTKDGTIDDVGSSMNLSTGTKQLHALFRSGKVLSLVMKNLPKSRQAHTQGVQPPAQTKTPTATFGRVLIEVCVSVRVKDNILIANTYTERIGASPNGGDRSRQKCVVASTAVLVDWKREVLEGQTSHPSIYRQKSDLTVIARHTSCSHTEGGSAYDSSDIIRLEDSSLHASLETEGNYSNQKYQSISHASDADVKTRSAAHEVNDDQSTTQRAAMDRPPSLSSVEINLGALRVTLDLDAAKHLLFIQHAMFPPQIQRKGEIHASRQVDAKKKFRRKLAVNSVDIKCERISIEATLGDEIQYKLLLDQISFHVSSPNSGQEDTKMSARLSSAIGNVNFASHLPTLGASPMNHPAARPSQPMCKSDHKGGAKHLGRFNFSAKVENGSFHISQRERESEMNVTSETITLYLAKEPGAKENSVFDTSFTNTSMPAMGDENSCKQSCFAGTDIVIFQSRGYDMFIKSCKEANLGADASSRGTAPQMKQKVKISTSSVDFMWSPVLHWLIVSLKQTSSLAVHQVVSLQNTGIGQHRHNNSITSKEEGRVPTDIHIQAKSALHFRVVAGKKSVVDVETQDIIIDVEHSSRGLWSKPNVFFQTKRLSVYMADSSKNSPDVNGRRLAVLELSSFVFRKNIRHATEQEFGAYQREQAKHQNYEPESTLFRLDGLVTDMFDCPLKEEFDFEVGTLSVHAPPGLHVGKIIDDISLTPRVLREGLNVAGLGKPKATQMRRHQLMSTTAKVSFLDVSLLEVRPERSSDVGKPSPEHLNHSDTRDLVYTNIFRLCMPSASITLHQNIPPSRAQSIINELDEDKTHTHAYVIKGGEMEFSTKQIVCFLRPLTLGTPLLAVRECHVTGLMFLAGLSPKTDGLIAGKTVRVPLHCVHHLQSCTERCICNEADGDAKCSCSFGVNLHSSGIPPKFYSDLDTSFEEVNMTWGPVVDSVPKLLDIVQLLIPPSPSVPPTPTPVVQNLAPSRKLGWWDNMRYWIHGVFKSRVQSLSVRWLLDLVSRADWSLLFECQNCIVESSLGCLATELSHVVVSCPGIAYDSVIKTPYNRLSDVCNTKGVNGQHSLLLVPQLNVTWEFGWQLEYSCGMTSSSDHHCVYLCPSAHSPAAFFSRDKFQRFRSCGIASTISATFVAAEGYNNWLALRIDVLPWLTHKNPTLPSSPQKQRVEDSPGILPAIDTLSVKIEVMNLKVATWFKETDSTVFLDAPDLDESAGLCLIVPQCYAKVVFGGCKKVELHGPIQAALLEISNTVLNASQNMNGSDDIMDMYDQMTGLLGSSLVDLTKTMESEASGEQEEDGAVDPSEEPLFGQQNDCDVEHDMFRYLQQLSMQMSELDHLLVVTRIDILNQSLASLLEGPRGTFSAGEEENKMSTRIEEASVKKQNPNLCLSNFRQNHYCLCPYRASSEYLKGESQPMVTRIPSTSACKEVRNTATWSVLVSGMKLLWTVEIRDCVTSIVADLVHTINIMKVQARIRTQPAEGRNHEQKREGPLQQEPQRGDNLAAVPRGVDTKSSLTYLLRQNTGSSSCNEDDDFGNLQFEGSTGVVPETIGPASLEKGNEASKNICERSIDMIIKSNKTAEYDKFVPLFDIHFSNPQIQLHSESTGGSLVVALRGIHVEGRKFVNLLSCNQNGETETDAVSLETVLRKTEFLYALDKVEIYAVNSGVDISAGLQWLKLVPCCDSQKTPDDTKEATQNSFPTHLSYHEPVNFAKPYLLKQIMEECTFCTTQTRLQKPSDMSKEEIEELLSRRLVLPLFSGLAENQLEGKGSMHRAVLDNVTMNIDELSFFLDSEQFSTTIDLIRNVLLEPGKPPRQRHQQIFASDNSSVVFKEAANDDSQRASIRRSSCERSTHETQMRNLLKQWHTGKLKQQKGKKGRQLLSYAAKCLLLELEDSSLLNGDILVNRIYYTLGKAKWKIDCIDVEFHGDVEINFTELHGQHDFAEDGSVVSQLSLEDLHISSTKPGPDSIYFLDPTVVVATAIGIERPPCQRCGLQFDRISNERNSCRFHADKYGRPGMFNLSTSAGTKGSWSCCKAAWQAAPGCVARPHSSRERVADVRLEALPRAVDGITLYKHCEINVYPNVHHTLIVQMTRSLGCLFMAYFMGEKVEETVDDCDLSTESGETDSSASATQGTGDKISYFPSHKKSVLLGSASTARDDCSALTGGAIHDDDTQIKADSKPKKEIFFIKYWRIGYINVDVSVAGFPVIPENLNLQILVPAFSRAYKVGSANYLGHKYLAHLIQEVIKSAASSGFVKVREKLKGQTSEPASTNIYKSAMRKSLVELEDHSTDKDASSDSPDSKRDAEADRTDLILGMPGNKVKSRSKLKRLIQKYGS